MNRNTRTLIVLTVAVLTAALAAGGMYFVILNRTPPPAQKVYVAVAKKNLPMGSVVAEADVKMVPWPKDSLIAGALTSTDKVKDHTLLSDVIENEPITEGKLAEKGFGLTPKIDKGTRAMSVKVNEVIGVAGFVTPGTRVDVVVTMRRNQGAMSRIVVENVVVLTAGAKYDDPDARKQGKAMPSTVVTLMVTPQQAERIAIASTQGQIMLALRSPLDKEPGLTTGITDAQMMGWAGSDPAPKPGPTSGGSKTTSGPKPPPLPPPPPPPEICFETFKAGKHEVVPCP